MIRRVLGTGLAVAAVSTILGFAAPAASATDCQALQNTYAAASAAALKRAGELKISDEDFRVLRDELQKLGADGELTSQELIPLTLRNEAARKLSASFTDNDQRLIQNLIKAHNTYVAAGCDKTNGDADKGTSTDVKESTAPTSKAAAPTSKAVAPTSTAVAPSRSQVSTVPNDAPETGDGSTEVYTSPEAINAQVVAYLALSSVAGVGVFTALRRSTGR